jgi:formylglycine-generating enzyme required for sulfatase activity
MSTGSKWINDKNAEFPKVKVECRQAKEFCDRLTEKFRKLKLLPEGYYFSLPTEAQWEYAAGGGQYRSGLRYSGSDNIDSVAWYGKNSKGGPQKVGLKEPNELGIYDMSGNVAEWCLDSFKKEYDKNDVIDPFVSSTIYRRTRVCRGGSWNSTQAEMCGVVARDHNNPEDYYGDIGFRIVLVYDKTSKEKDLSAKQWTERMDKIGKWKISDLFNNKK